jgi:hypothetical protein
MDSLLPQPAAVAAAARLEVVITTMVFYCVQTAASLARRGVRVFLCKQDAQSGVLAPAIDWLCQCLKEKGVETFVLASTAEIRSLHAQLDVVVGRLVRGQRGKDQDAAPPSPPPGSAPEPAWKSRLAPSMLAGLSFTERDPFWQHSPADAESRELALRRTISLRENALLHTVTADALQAEAETELQRVRHLPTVMAAPPPAAVVDWFPSQPPPRARCEHAFVAPLVALEEGSGDSDRRGGKRKRHTAADGHIDDEEDEEKGSLDAAAGTRVVEADVTPIGQRGVYDQGNGVVVVVVPEGTAEGAPAASATTSEDDGHVIVRLQHLAPQGRAVLQLCPPREPREPFPIQTYMALNGSSWRVSGQTPPLAPPLADVAALAPRGDATGPCCVAARATSPERIRVDEDDDELASAKQAAQQKALARLLELRAQRGLLVAQARELQTQLAACQNELAKLDSELENLGPLLGSAVAAVAE